MRNLSSTVIRFHISLLVLQHSQNPLSKIHPISFRSPPSVLLDIHTDFSVTTRQSLCRRPRSAPSPLFQCLRASLFFLGAPLFFAGAFRLALPSINECICLATPPRFSTPVSLNFVLRLMCSFFLSIPLFSAPSVAIFIFRPLFFAIRRMRNLPFSSSLLTGGVDPLLPLIRAYSQLLPPSRCAPLGRSPLGSCLFRLFFSCQQNLSPSLQYGSKRVFLSVCALLRVTPPSSLFSPPPLPTGKEILPFGFFPRNTLLHFRFDRNRGPATPSSPAFLPPISFSKPQIRVESFPFLRTGTLPPSSLHGHQPISFYTCASDDPFLLPFHAVEHVSFLPLNDTEVGPFRKIPFFLNFFVHRGSHSPPSKDVTLSLLS